MMLSLTILWFFIFQPHCYLFAYGMSTFLANKFTAGFWASTRNKKRVYSSIVFLISGG